MIVKLNNDHQPMVDVKFNWCPFPLPFIIDTGCRDNYIFIDGDPETETRFNKTGERLYAVAAGGQEFDCPEILEPISIANLNFNVSFGVKQGTFKSAQGILGAKFLYDHNVSLHLSRGRFLLKKISWLDSLYFLFHTS